MRVIAGSARSLKLKTIEGMETRPTTDRIKETLFNMINADISGCVFVDLFAGSGGIGIEALSRGAKKAFFVDNNKKCINCIEDNLKFTKLSEKSIVWNVDVILALRKIKQKGEICDIIFMDPPYNNNCEKEVLKELESLDIIDEYSIIIVEASLETDFSYINEDSVFEIYKEKIYKTNKHVFLRYNVQN